MIELLENKHVKVDNSTQHGFWEFGERDELLIRWYYRGNVSEPRRDSYAPIPSTKALQLIALPGSAVEYEFLLPVARERTLVTLDFMYHCCHAKKWDFHFIALQEGGVVSFSEGRLNGRWHLEDSGALVINFQFNADGNADNIKEYRFHKLPHTDAWRLLYLGGASIQDVTLLLPYSH